MMNFLQEQLAVYISDQVPEMLIGDPGRFRQIMTNLMGNSIKVSILFRISCDRSFSFFCKQAIVSLSCLG